MWLLLAGCAPGPFTEADAGAVFGAVTSVNEDVYALVWSRTQPLPGEDDTDTGGTPPPEDAAAKGMQWHTAAEGGSFEGTVDGPGSWTGAVALDGVYGLAEGEDGTLGYTWGMDASYEDVGFGTLTLDGDFRWDIVASYDGAQITHTSTIAGDLTGGGSAAGTGAIETVTRVTLSGGRYVVEVSGTVGGWDVSTEYDASAYAL